MINIHHRPAICQARQISIEAIPDPPDLPVFRDTERDSRARCFGTTLIWMEFSAANKTSLGILKREAEFYPIVLQVKRLQER